MTKVRTIDEYLAPLSADKRAALSKLRRDIQAAAPSAEECIAYGVPTFKVGGRMLVSFGAATKHCSFYPGAHPVETFRKELMKYSTSKGTIRFPPDQPLPSALVRKIIRLRFAERAQRDAAKVRAKRARRSSSGTAKRSRRKTTSRTRAKRRA